MISRYVIDRLSCLPTLAWLSSAIYLSLLCYLPIHACYICLPTRFATYPPLLAIYLPFIDTIISNQSTNTTVQQQAVVTNGAETGGQVFCNNHHGSSNNMHNSQSQNCFPSTALTSSSTFCASTEIAGSPTSAEGIEATSDHHADYAMGGGQPSNATTKHWDDEWSDRRILCCYCFATKSSIFSPTTTAAIHSTTPIPPSATILPCLCLKQEGGGRRVEKVQRVHRSLTPWCRYLSCM